MENALVGIVGTIMVLSVVVLIFVAGLVTIVKTARKVYQSKTESYITISQATKISEENAALKNQNNTILSALNKKKATT